MGLTEAKPNQPFLIDPATIEPGKKTSLSLPYLEEPTGSLELQPEVQEPVLQEIDPSEHARQVAEDMEDRCSLYRG